MTGFTGWPKHWVDRYDEIGRQNVFRNPRGVQEVQAHIGAASRFAGKAPLVDAPAAEHRTDAEGM